MPETEHTSTENPSEEAYVQDAVENWLKDMDHMAAFLVVAIIQGASSHITKNESLCLCWMYDDFSCCKGIPMNISSMYQSLNYCWVSEVFIVDFHFSLNLVNPPNLYHRQLRCFHVDDNW